jgi:DNA repair exonuclease SbcCD nuclease subunit
MKVVLAGDLHAADRPPSSCTPVYRDDMLDLLHQAVSLATAHQAPLVLAGDILHAKAPSRTSHKLILDLIRTFKHCRQDVYVVPGNHDVQNDRYESLVEGQPLGVLAAAGAVRLLRGWDLEHFSGAMGDKPPLIYGVPWLQHWTDDAVDAALWQYRTTTLVATRSARPLVVAHAPLYPPGLELKWEHYPAAKFAEAMGGYGSVFYGHVHEPHGVWSEGGVVFCNNGALSRGSLHEYNLDRQVGVTVWDDSDGSFEFIPLASRPASEVFRLTEVTETKAAEGRLADFLAAIDSADLQVVSIEAVMAHIRDLDLGADETELIEELLAGAHG